MESKIKQVKKSLKIDEPKSVKPDLNAYSKKKLADELAKLGKMQLKIENSIKNHNSELKDKELALAEIKKEVEILKGLEKQLL